MAEFGIEGRLEFVLWAWDEVAEHPMPEQAGVWFVRGDLTAVDFLARACVERAVTVVGSKVAD
ncbi:MAG: hypothetical protein ACRDTC_05935, partial [Pseudonocardiaceae bacterium]